MQAGPGPGASGTVWGSSRALPEPGEVCSTHTSTLHSGGKETPSCAHTTVGPQTLAHAAQASGTDYPRGPQVDPTSSGSTRVAGATCKAGHMLSYGPGGGAGTGAPAELDEGVAADNPRQRRGDTPSCSWTQRANTDPSKGSQGHLLSARALRGWGGKGSRVSRDNPSPKENPTGVQASSRTSLQTCLVPGPRDPPHVSTPPHVATLTLPDGTFVQKGREGSLWLTGAHRRPQPPGCQGTPAVPSVLPAPGALTRQAWPQHCH